jgi:hypothetical protein
VKAATLEDVKDFIRPFNMGDGNEGDDRELLYSARDSAGDDEPPADLVEAFENVAKRVAARFPGFEVRVYTVDEWVSLKVTAEGGAA